jgi:hypothetical protein
VTGQDVAGALAEVCRLHAAVITGGQARPGARGGQIRAFTASLNAPRAARRFAVAALRDCGAGHRADDAAIVVAEFAAKPALTGPDAVRLPGPARRNRRVPGSGAAPGPCGFPSRCPGPHRPNRPGDAASGPANAAPDDQPGANLIVTHVPSGPQVALI